MNLRPILASSLRREAVDKHCDEVMSKRRERDVENTAWERHGSSDEVMSDRRRFDEEEVMSERKGCDE